MYLNKVILLGNVGKDPEVRYLENNTPYARFPLATSETFKNKAGERVTATEWHNVTAWHKLAEIVEKYVKKGKELYIEGSIRTRSWEDKDGNKKYVTEIIATDITLGRSPEKTEQTATVTSQEATTPVEENKEDFNVEEADDLPF